MPTFHTVMPTIIETTEKTTSEVTITRAVSRLAIVCVGLVNFAGFIVFFLFFTSL